MPQAIEKGANFITRGVRQGHRLPDARFRQLGIGFEQGLGLVEVKTVIEQAGGIIFSTVVVLLGYQFASSLSTLEKYLRYWAIVFLAIAMAVIIYLKRKLEHFIEEPEMN